jgi:hypothetical protein
LRRYIENSDTTAKIWLRLRQEIILSYRLLFGQDQASRQLFRRLSRLQAPGRNGAWGRGGGGGGGGGDLLSDPLLDVLCGQRTSSAGLRALPPDVWPAACRRLDGSLRKQDEYSARYDLPLLGRRLLVLQEFNQRQRPRSFWGLWKDRRDKPRWYAFWAVLIVGGAALFLAALQVALSAAQLAE